MTYITNKDFLIEVQKGNVDGHSIVHKFGRNDTIPNGSFEFVNLLGFTSWPITSPTTIRVKAGNAADSPSGAGAQSIEVVGLDNSLNEIQITLPTNGTSAGAASTEQFWRVYRAWVHPTGTYGGSNTGDVIIENGSGGTDLIKIAAGEGQTQFAAWSVPLGKKAYILGGVISVDSNKSADIRLCKRESLDDTTTPYSAQRLVQYFDGVSGLVPFQPRSPGSSQPAGTDIWVEARGSGGIAEVSVDLEILVEDT